MKVTIFPNSVENKVSQKGNAYSRQTMYFHLNDELPPEKVVSFVGDQGAYQQGKYTIDFESSLSVRDNALTIAPNLVAAK
jgi:hypothetical protein